ncbi:MAG: primosomal protein N' [Rhodothermaceae bacterium]|nr:primosomal protein N' [Rhodothermaceae bacterium]
MPVLAHVVPLTPVDGVFTYAVPEELEREAVPGARVVVPFGRRRLTGIVVERSEGEAAGLKAVEDVLDAEPALPERLLALTRWIADYYVCAWGEVLKAALPSGTEVESRRVVYRTAMPMERWSGNGIGQRVLAHFDGDLFGGADGGVGVEVLEAAVGQRVSASLLRRLQATGLVRVENELEEARVRVKTERRLRLADGIDLEAAGAALRGARQRMLLEALAEVEGSIAQADALQATGASSGTVKRLARYGFIEAFDAEVERTADEMEQPVEARAEVTLHRAQKRALGAVVNAVESERAETFLLHGVTGSGKTEVYIRALTATLLERKTAIVLVPEIALTPQTVRRFRAHFGDRVAVLHSRMSPGERFDAWRAIRAERYPIVIGPRSAVFAPLENLGLVVVDEEHETSYKQFDPAPRYHARDVAVMRAHQAGAVCVLGSATPSLESLANARAGKYTLLTMPERVPVKGHAAAPLPPVRVVNLTREKKVRRLKGALSDDLRDAITARLERCEQVILLQNRRGYAPILTCDDCGFTPQCRDCAVSLTVHKPKRQLRCHYCGWTERLPVECPSCSSSALAFLGAGTQRIEEELADVFPAARVLRMDLDTTSRKGAHRRLLNAFGRGEADILLGTQMVAKGLDFPRVTLVGVVNADTGMLLPDFRAAERTFQLLAQVAGRAGRRDLPGEVILQTRNPDHPALQFALAHDFDGFAAHELRDREVLGYPPFGRLVGIEFKGPEERSVQALAEQWTRGLVAEAQKVARLEVLGPTAAFVGRVKRQWRFHAILKAPRALPPSVLAAVVRGAQDRSGSLPKGHRVNVDVDPVGLY